MAVHVVTEFVGQNGFDFIGGIVRQQGVGENDAARVAQSGEGGIRFLAFFRELPLVNPADPGAGPLPQLHQPRLQFLIFKRFELVKDWKQDHRSQLGQQDEQSHETPPRRSATSAAAPGG